MTPAEYTEDNLVQRTTAEYLEQQLGWESIYAFNKENFGPESLLGRKDDREVVLTRYLRNALMKLNPSLPDSAYEDAIRNVTEFSSSQTPVSINQEKYEFIRNGILVSYRNERGELKKERLQLIDYDKPENNHFLCVRELWVKSDLYRKRADIVGFVNGLPLLFMELKNVSKDIKCAYEQNFSDYKDTIPHLFHHNALVILANGIDAKLGAITSRFEHFHEWKRLSEEEVGVVDMETLLKGVCSKGNFIDIVENFILFDSSTGEPIKIIARNHQFLGVNQAIESVKERKEREGKLGVFWHTQGAGKSYSMVFFTRKIHRSLGGNFTFLILTDRDDLDTQIYKTFAGCGVVDNDRNPCRAASGKHLNGLFTEHKSYVFTLIQKFNREVEPEMPYSDRDDIIVITDEAHRTQYGTLSLNMRNALPNASFIGFTGTPLFNDDEITRRVFGDYVSTYDFQRAVEDGATVPLYYDARGEKLGIAIGDLNERIAEKLENYEAESVDVEQKLERELKRDYHIITAEKRLNQVAHDFVIHYSTAWESGKVMFVSIDKITALRMYALVENHWKERIKELESTIPACSDEQEEILLRRQIQWMKETRMAVVVSEEQGEVEKFRKWGIDIKPHRRLMKAGIDLPESLRTKPKFRNLQRMDLDDAFKEKEHPFRIVFVCAMWLTGFDVPSLSTLYLDKPLKAHTLMQAIARANRVLEGKNNGLVVDYCGILVNLRKALATFAGGTHEGGKERDPLLPPEQLILELKEAIRMAEDYLIEKGASLDDIVNEKGFDKNAAFREGIKAAKEAVNETDETRKRFEIICRDVFKKFKACINHPEINEYRNKRDAINTLYKSLQSDRNNSDISDIIRELHSVVDAAIFTKADDVSDTGILYNISKIDFERLKQEFEKKTTKRSIVQNLKDAIEKKLSRLLSRNPLRSDFQKHYEEIVDAYNREKDRATIEKTFEDLMRFYESMNEEESRAAREGLDQETLAVFDLLRKESLSAPEIKRIKSIAVELLAKLKKRIAEIDHWKEGENTRDSVRVEIRNFLWSDETGLPVGTYSENEVEQKTEDVFRHVLRVYPTVPSPFYGDVA